EYHDHASARHLRLRGPVGYLHVHYHAFEVLPVRLALGFIADHAVNGRTMLLFTFGRFSAQLDLAHAFRFLRRRYFHAVRDQDVGGQLLVDGRDVVVLRAVVEDANHRIVRAVQHFEDAAFRASVRADRAELDQHAVAMHRVTDRLRVDEDV